MFCRATVLPAYYSSQHALDRRTSVGTIRSQATGSLKDPDKPQTGQFENELF